MWTLILCDCLEFSDLARKFIRKTFRQFYPPPDPCAEKFPLVSMGGWAEGLLCANPGARTPISDSGNYLYLGLQWIDSLLSFEESASNFFPITFHNSISTQLDEYTDQPWHVCFMLSQIPQLICCFVCHLCVWSCSRLGLGILFALMMLYTFTSLVCNAPRSSMGSLGCISDIFSLLNIY